MSYSAPLEMLTDVLGSVTFGWADQGVYYARFSHGLSAKLGQAFAARLKQAALSVPRLEYFADARALESYDLLARSAFVRVVNEHRARFEQLNVLWWSGSAPNPAYVSALGEPLFITTDAIDFETRLLRSAPRARSKLGQRSEAAYRSRWPLRR